MRGPTYDQLWVACQNEPWTLVRWFECHPSLAGYLQAVAVLVTLLITVFGPPLRTAYKAWTDYRERIRRSRSIARSLGNSVNIVGFRAREAWTLVNENTERPSDTLVITLLVRRLLVELPGDIDVLSLAPPSGIEPSIVGPFLELAGRVREHNGYLSPKAHGDWLPSEAEWPGFIELVRDSLRHILEAVRRALSIIGEEPRNQASDQLSESER